MLLCGWCYLCTGQTGYGLELDILHADRRGNDVIIKHL